MMEKNNLTKYLKEEELKIFKEILRWEENPGNQFFHTITLSIVKELKKISPATLNFIADILREILKSLRDYSHNTVDMKTIFQKISFAGERPVNSLEEIRQIPITKLDIPANQCMLFHKFSAAIGGGLTGAIGFNGFIIDLPILYTLLFRTIQEVAICYGYPIDTPEEKVYILKILELGHLAEDDARKNTLIELSYLHAAIQGGISLSQLEKIGFFKGLQVVAERIGLQYLRKKLNLYFMLIGGISGAGINYLIADQVANAAYHSYRRRYLMDRAIEREKSGESSYIKPDNP